MPTFQYEAMDSAGRPVTAQIDAGTPAEAMMRIRAQGYFPTKVRQVARTSPSPESNDDSPAPTVGSSNVLSGSSRSKRHPANLAAFQSRAPWWGGALFALVGLLFLMVAWILGVTQHYRLVTYKPVAARIVNAHIETSHGKHGPSYSASITYTYTVNGQPYESSQVYAMPGTTSSSSYRDADLICRQHPAGSAATAWVSPTNPSSAFLLRDVSAMPHIFSFFALPFFAIGVVLLFMRLAGGRIPQPTAVDGGWYQLKEAGTIRRRFWLCAVLAVGWYIYAGTVVGDYMVLRGSNQIAIVAAAAVAGCLGLIPLWLAWRYRRLMHDFLNAQVRINVDPVRVGSALKVQVRQSLLHPLDVAEFSIGLVCVEDTCKTFGRKTTYASDEACSVWNTLVTNRAFGMGEEIAGETTLAMPEDANPSGCANRSGYPYYHWYIALYVDARGEPQLNAHFPIRIES